MENVAVTACKGFHLLKVNKVFKDFVRHGNRINVQKPRPSHYDRAKIEHLVKPRYFEKGERESWFLPLASQCMKEKEIAYNKQRKHEDNPYEKLLAKDLRERFMKSKLIAFFHANPIRADDRFEIEVRLKKEDMYLKTIGKHTVNMALEGTPYISAMSLFVSHTEMVFCEEPKVDSLLKIANKMHQHVLLAAIVEDRLLSVSQLKTLSQLKDLTTARAQLVGVLNTAQSQLVSSLTYHQNSIVAGLQQLAMGSQESGTESQEVIPQSPAESETKT